MRTTIRMKDDILTAAKIEAARRQISLTSLIEESLAQYLGKGSKIKDDVRKFNVITFKGNGVCHGVNLDDGSSLLDRMEDVSI